MEMSPLVLREIFGVVVDTLPTDAKYPVEYYENLRLPIEMQLSKKQKDFSEFVVLFMDSASRFKHFKKKT